MRRRQFLIDAGLTLGLSSIGLTAPVGFARPAGASPAIKPVGVRVGFGKGWSEPSPGPRVTRLAHTMPVAASDIQLVYANVARSEKEFEAAGPNPILISAAIEFPEGAVHPASFASRPEVTVAGGDTVVGDPVHISIPAGARYFTRTTVRAEAPPYLCPFSRWSSPQCGDWVNARADPSLISESLPSKRGQPSKAFGPLNILGKTPAPDVAVAILGDSVVAGEPGAGDPLGDLGYVERALAGNIPWCNLAVGGDGLERFLRFHPTRLGVIRDNFTHAICALGIQDIREGNETAIRAHFLQVWQMLADLGLKVFQTTITTHTSSTDRWTTTQGQTIVNPNFLPGGIYHRINDWIRSVPAPLAGCFDPSALLETEPDSGIWIAPDQKPVTPDGAHLGALGAEIAARSVDVSKLRTCLSAIR